MSNVTITQLMVDIKNRVKAAPLMEGRVGTTPGGKSSDPTMRKAVTPFAWVLYVGNNTRTARAGIAITPVTHTVIVKIAVPYGTEADLENISWPVLEQVIEYVTDTPIAAFGACTRWTYEGTALEELDERMVYEQRYSVQGNL